MISDCNSHYQAIDGQPTGDPHPSALVNAEPCPVSTDFTVEGCRDFVTVRTNSTVPGGLGRIVQVDAVLRNVCPGKRLAAAVMLTELDGAGREHSRGVKTLLIPAQPGEGCRDLELRCIQFVLPEALDPVGSPSSLCNERNFRVRVTANYIDTDFISCDCQTVLQ